MQLLVMPVTGSSEKKSNWIEKENDKTNWGKCQARKLPREIRTTVTHLNTRNSVKARRRHYGEDPES
jgi:hypothetical protein